MSQIPLIKTKTSTQVCETPMYDDLTGRALILLRLEKNNEIKNGFYVCSCKEKVKKSEVLINEKYVLDSLMAHQIMCHREDVSSEEHNILLKLSEKYNVNKTINENINLKIIKPKFKKNKKHKKNRLITN